MPKVSQNKKVAISAIALFIVLFSIMLFFLGDKQSNLGKSSVLHGEQEHAVGFKYLSITPLYKAYLASFEDPIFVTNKEGEFEYANELYEKEFKSDLEDFIGKKFFDYVNTKDLAELANVYTNIIQSGKSISAMGPFRMIAGEKEKLVLLSAIPLKNSELKVEKIIFVVKDLTDKVEGLNDGVKAQEKEIKSWVDRLYPKIQEIENSDTKMLVDKISYMTK